LFLNVETQETEWVCLECFHAHTHALLGRRQAVHLPPVTDLNGRITGIDREWLKKLANIVW
jgi:hypothetical protein